MDKTFHLLSITWAALRLFGLTSEHYHISQQKPPWTGDTPDLSLATVMRVCTQTVILVPSWPETCPLCFAGFVSAEGTQCQFYLNLQWQHPVQFPPAVCQRKRCRAWPPSPLAFALAPETKWEQRGSDGLALQPLYTVQKYLHNQQGCPVLSWTSYLSPIQHTDPRPPSPLPVCGQGSFASQCPATPRWPSFRAQSRTTSQAWRIKKTNGSCWRGGWLRWDKEAHSGSNTYGQV